MSDFIADYCCTKEQAEQLVALGVRPISLFKYRPDGTVFKLDGWQVWESYDGRTVPCWTVGELQAMWETVCCTPLQCVDSLCSWVKSYLDQRDLDRDYHLCEINAYLESKLCAAPLK